MGQQIEASNGANEAYASGSDEQIVGISATASRMEVANSTVLMKSFEHVSE